MTRITLTLDLPNALAREAQATGLLRKSNMVGIIRQEVRKRKTLQKIGDYFNAVAQDTQTPPAMKEIEAEVSATRKKWLPRHAGRS